MNEISIILFFYVICLMIIKIGCTAEEKEIIEPKETNLMNDPVKNRRNPLPEIPIERERHDPNLVSVLLNNVKEIFNDIIENESVPSNEITRLSSISTLPSLNPSPLDFELSKPTVTDNYPKIPIISVTSVTAAKSIFPSTSTPPPVPPPRTDVAIYQNTSIVDGSYGNAELGKQLTTGYMRKSKHNIDKDPEYYGIHPEVDTERAFTDYVTKIITPKETVARIEQETVNPYAANKNYLDVAHESERRSCILCNNIEAEDCNSPKNKLIPSMTCERDDDVCYSMHTPFGIVDRGCYNSNHNLSTYVCSCNLCNHIPLSGMPFTFASKKEWVENVIDISHTRSYRKSIFKDMSCLKCEVNTTLQTGDVHANANCLEGNIGSVPVAECARNEVCAVRALKANGYIWRGCVKTPLYNYWWTLCDFDLCNFETIASIYDYVGGSY